MEPEDTARPLTKGEFRVGIQFNPSHNGMVAQIKEAAARLIDFIDLIDDGSGVPYGNDHEQNVMNERRRLKALAQTAIEDGAMWAVKAATKA